GPLWEFRLMMNFSGQNRGFAYAKYGTSAVATDAIRLLNGHMLEPGFRLSVRRSIEKRQLCIGDLPDATRQQDLLQVLRVFAEGVEKVSLKTGPGINGVSAIVTFSSHHSASMAKKVVVEAFKKHFALTVSIKWQSTEKHNPNEPQPLQKPPKSLPLPLKPPRYACRHPSLPPRLAVPPSISPGFCRAVGGPPVPQQLQPSFCYQGHPVFAGSPVAQQVLRRVNGGGITTDFNGPKVIRQSSAQLFHGQVFIPSLFHLQRAHNRSGVHVK
uniref:Dead end protein 1-like n=1 Tax=Acanthochromis polyacanthus TaxID=80966 RepID=A0A3Q1GEN2_9TELE